MKGISKSKNNKIKFWGEKHSQGSNGVKTVLQGKKQNKTKKTVEYKEKEINYTYWNVRDFLV